MHITFATVSKSFGDVQALQEISLHIESGELFFLLGPSGCGKTTLLRIIAGFEEATSGTLLFDDRDMRGTPPHRRNTAMVFQGYALWPHMTVAQNVAFGLEVKGESREAREHLVAAALAKVRIEDLADRKPNELSGGQQQRVALARTLAVEPSCLLLDEPLANLDAKLRNDMRAEIRRICKESGLTAVYVTHDRKEALSMADRLAVFDRGSILQVGAPREVYSRPANTFVASFIGEANFVPARVVRTVGQEIEARTESASLRSNVPRDAMAEGQSVTLLLRPEAISIVPPEKQGQDAPNLFEATLDSTTYLGELAEHVVTTPGHETLRVFELNPRRAYRAGSPLRLSVSPEDVIVLAE